MGTIEVLIALVEAGRLPSRESWVGLGAAHLDELEAHLGHPIPRAYREFLAYVGATRQSVAFEGSDIYWPRPLDLKADFVDAYPDVGVPADSTFIFGHQGYIFFCCIGFDDDPPVVGIQPPSNVGGFTPAGARFTDWLLQFGLDW